jgi:transposase
MNSPQKSQVFLTAEQRTHFERMARSGDTPARKARYARLLLHTDGAHPDGRRSDAWIAEALGMHVNTVARVRKDFATSGEATALERKPRLTPAIPRKIDGRVEAHLVEICCSQAPEGHARWTLNLMADELKARGLVTSVCIETVRRALKKIGCNPGRRSAGVSLSETRPGSSPRWSTCSTSTPPSIRQRNR